MKIRTASLLFAFVFATLPAYAQGPPGVLPGGGAIQALADDLAALAARVSKLEGNIVASDLAGTWSIVVLDTTLHGLNGPLHPAAIETSVIRATLTLNADFTGSGSNFSCEGSRLTLGTGAMSALVCNEDESGVTWTYANGVLTLTFLGDGDVIPLTVALGGRYAIGAFSPFHPGDPSSNHFLIILTRLQ